MRVKGSKGGTVPAKQSPAMDSVRAGQKRSRTEDVPSQAPALPSQAPAQPSAASLNGKGQEQPSDTKQEESDGELGLAGLLGGHFRTDHSSGISYQYLKARAGCCTCSDMLSMPCDLVAAGVDGKEQQEQAVHATHGGSDGKPGLAGLLGKR